MRQGLADALELGFISLNELLVVQSRATAALPFEHRFL